MVTMVVERWGESGFRSSPPRPLELVSSCDDGDSGVRGSSADSARGRAMEQ